MINICALFSRSIEVTESELRFAHKISLQTLLDFSQISKDFINSSNAYDAL